MQPDLNHPDVAALLSQIRPYWLLLLHKGPNYLQPNAQQIIQTQHAPYLLGLRAQGKLALSGPVMDDSTLAGMAVYGLTDRAEIEALMAQDPGISSGVLRAELHPWMAFPGDSLPQV